MFSYARLIQKRSLMNKNLSLEIIMRKEQNEELTATNSSAYKFSTNLKLNRKRKGKLIYYQLDV